MQDPTGVINWRRLTAQLTTSGQPSETQLAEIAGLGVTHIVNLGPHTNKGALVDETKSVTDLGMRYLYIPVDFEAPTQDDFAAFCDVMDRHCGAMMHVHCIYNARVSAFFYRYALEGRGGDVNDAFARMDSIWRPGGVWADFIAKPQDAKLPNRYAGEDYTL